MKPSEARGASTSQPLSPPKAPKLFVATPMYGGQCYGAYTDSMIKLALHCREKGIDFHYFPIFNESHIDRARNVCADEFLLSDSTHLLFWDGDLSARPGEAVKLMSYREEIICGLYPKKRINWKLIRNAVLMGIGRDDPEELARYIGDLVFTPALRPDANTSRSIFEISDIHEGGTGFMLIKREVLERIALMRPDLRIPRFMEKPDSHLMTWFFDGQLDDTPRRRFITEDYSFCKLARSAGYNIYLAPWIKFTHHGYYQFQGDISRIAAVMQMEEAA